MSKRTMKSALWGVGIAVIVTTVLSLMGNPFIVSLITGVLSGVGLVAFSMMFNAISGKVNQEGLSDDDLELYLRDLEEYANNPKSKG